MSLIIELMFRDLHFDTNIVLSARTGEIIYWDINKQGNKDTSKGTQASRQRVRLVVVSSLFLHKWIAGRTSTYMGSPIRNDVLKCKSSPHTTSQDLRTPPSSTMNYYVLGTESNVPRVDVCEIYGKEPLSTSTERVRKAKVAQQESGKTEQRRKYCCGEPPLTLTGFMSLAVPYTGGGAMDDSDSESERENDDEDGVNGSASVGKAILSRTYSFTTRSRSSTSLTNLHPSSSFSPSPRTTSCTGRIPNPTGRSRSHFRLAIRKGQPNPSPLSKDIVQPREGSPDSHLPSEVRSHGEHDDEDEHGDSNAHSGSDSESGFRDTLSFLVCQRMLHKCHEIIFGDLPPRTGLSRCIRYPAFCAIRSRPGWSPCWSVRLCAGWRPRRAPFGRVHWKGCGEQGRWEYGSARPQGINLTGEDTAPHAQESQPASVVDYVSDDDCEDGSSPDGFAGVGRQPSNNSSRSLVADKACRRRAQPRTAAQTTPAFLMHAGMITDRLRTLWKNAVRILLRRALYTCPLARMRYISGTKLNERIIDLGYKEDRKYGRGKSGGQARDEHRQDYDAGRGGDATNGPNAVAGGGGDWKELDGTGNPLKCERSPEDKAESLRPTARSRKDRDQDTDS
ncbi:hypothetical protein BU17DRAFT_100059 [Hysterangium stoloniferum]|nr:hypothetical protein BU17DRAFT_100059 [Hysterangium stoloniferum]